MTGRQAGESAEENPTRNPSPPDRWADQWAGTHVMRPENVPAKSEVDRLAEIDSDMATGRPQDPWSQAKDLRRMVRKRDAQITELKAEITRLRARASEEEVEDALDLIDDATAEVADLVPGNGPIVNWRVRKSIAYRITAALRDAEARARRVALEEAAQLCEQVAAVDDESDLGERMADAFNENMRHRDMSARLRSWNALLAQGIRTLASAP